MAIVIATATAQMQEYQSLFREFGDCLGAEFGSTDSCEKSQRYNAQCCNFRVVEFVDCLGPGFQGTQECENKFGDECCDVKALSDPIFGGQFCVSDEQRQNAFAGKYRDFDNTLWFWQCQLPVPTPEEKEQKIIAKKIKMLPVYSNYLDKDMQWVIWSIYGAQLLYPVGLFFVSLPVGFLYIQWLQLTGMWKFLELLWGVGDFNGWLEGPFLSYWITQPVILVLSFIFAYQPGLNYITAPLFGWWANLDYYQYNFDLLKGPTLPPDEELDESE